MDIVSYILKFYGYVVLLTYTKITKDMQSRLFINFKT